MSEASSANPNRPDPIMTIEGAFFWKAANENRLAAQKCGGCGKLWHPPRAVCPDCLSFEKSEQTLTGKGRVISWIMPIHPAPLGFESPPIVALVEVEEGLRFVTNVEGVEPTRMRTGLDVAVAFATTRGGHQVPIFRPVEER